MSDIHSFNDASDVAREAWWWVNEEDDDKDLFFFSDWWQNGTFNYDEYESDVSTLDSKIQGYSDIAFTTFLTSTAFNVVIFLISLVMYELLRRCFPNVYASRREKEDQLRNAKEQAKKMNEQHGIDDSTVSVAMPALKKKKYSKLVPELSKTDKPLQWVGKVFGVSWKQVREAVGLDAYFYLRYIRMCLKITSVSAVWGAMILFPTYASGENGASGWYHVSMANVSQGSAIIWVSILYIYFFTFFVLYVMKQEYKHFVELRLDFLGKGDGLTEPQHQYSVIVENIPKELRGNKALYNYFDKLFPDKVHSASVILKIPKLEALSTSKLDATMSLEKSIAYYEATGKRPTHMTGRARTVIDGIDLSPVGFDPDKVVDLDMHYRAHDSVNLKAGILVDSIDYYTRELRHINNRMFLLQKERGEQAEVDDKSLRGFDKWFNTLSHYVDTFFHQLGNDSKDEEDENEKNEEEELNDDISYGSDTSSEQLGLSSSEESEAFIFDKPSRRPSTPWDHPDTKKNLMNSMKNDPSVNSGRFQSVVRFADDDTNDVRHVKKSQEIGGHSCSRKYDHSSSIELSPSIRLNKREKSVSSASCSLSAITDNSSKRGSPSNESIRSEESSPSNKIGMVVSQSSRDSPRDSPTRSAFRTSPNRKDRINLFHAQNTQDSPQNQSPSRIGMLLNPKYRRHVSQRSHLSIDSRSSKSSGRRKSSREEPLLKNQDGQDLNYSFSFEAQKKGESCLKNSMRTISSRQMNKLAGRLGFDFGAYMMKFITRRLQSHRDDEKKDVVSSTGFVTFTDLATVTCVASAPLSHKPKTLNVAVAPERRDIIWENCSRRADINESREFNANVSLVLGAVLWSVPLAGIQLLSSADMLARLPGLRWLANENNENLKTLINSYLPVVALLTIILILPYIFEAVAIYYERRKTVSDVNKSTVSRYFYYQLANIYISVTAGSIWISVSEILAHPYAVLEILGNSLPTVVGYFITLIVTKMLAGLPIIILRPYALCRYLFLRMIQSKKYMTQRELDNVYCLEPVYYGWEYPSQMLVITICFTYACISPIILIFGAMYFFAALMVYKKQVLYVYAPFYESGGDLFPLVCDRTITGLICGQLTFMGYSIVRGGHLLQVLSAMPLISFTLWVMIYFRNHYVKPSKRLTLELAMELDKKIEERAEFRSTSKYFAKGAKIPHDSFDPNYYKQPVLTESDGAPLFYRIQKQDEMTKKVREELKRSQLHVWEPKRSAVFSEDTLRSSKYSSRNEEAV